MDNTVTQEVLRRVDALAEKVGTTAEYMWPKLVAYTRTVAIAEIVIVGGAFVVVLIMFISKMIRGTKEKFDEGDTCGYAVAYGVLLAILTIAVVSGGASAIGRAFNPEASVFYTLFGR